MGTLNLSKDKNENKGVLKIIKAEHLLYFKIIVDKKVFFDIMDNRNTKEEEIDLKEKGTENNNNTHEKAFWVIGIALIVFLVLVLVSVLLLKSTREKANNLNGSLNLFGNQTENVNYETATDGVKRNNNEAVTRAEIDIDNIRFSHFGIVENNRGSEEAGIIDTDITFDIENMDTEEKGKTSFLVTLYDEKDTILTDFTIQIEKLPARKAVPFRQNLNISCVNAARVTVDKVDVQSSSNVSETNTSGE